MKNKLIILAVLLLAFGAWQLGRAQSTTPFTVIAQSLSHTSCPAVIASTTQFCFANDGIWVSLNGAAYAVVNTGATGGVTSVQQCNLAGASCGTAQTGAVVLKVPQTVTVTVANPTVSVTAPAVTATATAPSASATQGAVSASLQ
jgi:hypothetical protein